MPPLPPPTDWNNPISGVLTTFDDAKAAGPAGLSQPKLGSPTTILITPQLAGQTVRVVAFLYDLSPYGRVVVEVTPPEETQDQFHATDQSLAAGNGKPGTRGTVEIDTVRGGIEARVAIGDEGIPASITWLEGGLQFFVLGRALTRDDALSLAEKV